MIRVQSASFCPYVEPFWGNSFQSDHFPDLFAQFHNAITSTAHESLPLSQMGLQVSLNLGQPNSMVDHSTSDVINMAAGSRQGITHSQEVPVLDSYLKMHQVFFSTVMAIDKDLMFYLL